MLWMIVVMGRFESESLVMDLITLGLALGTMFGPGRYIKAKAYHSFRRGILNQHVLLEAGAFAGLLGGFLGLFVFPGFPTVHFFAVSVFITRTTSSPNTRASSSARELHRPSRAFLTSNQIPLDASAMTATSRRCPSTN